VFVYLNRRRDGLENVVDLVFEATREHLVGLIEHKQLDAVGAQMAAAEHVVDATGRADHDVHAGLQLGNVVAHARATDARVAAYAQVVTDVDHHLYAHTRTHTSAFSIARAALALCCQPFESVARARASAPTRAPGTRAS
jgi:hypothetical protein